MIWRYFCCANSGKFRYLLVKQAIMMTDPVFLLQQVAAQLQQEGKTPSLALFRARLAGRVAPPQLFAAYQHWRNNPVIAPTVEAGPPSTPAQDEPASPDNVAAALARIEAKLDLLLSKLDNA
jgi:hypothetical protein